MLSTSRNNGSVENDVVPRFGATRFEKALKTMRKRVFVFNYCPIPGTETRINILTKAWHYQLDRLYPKHALWSRLSFKKFVPPFFSFLFFVFLFVNPFFVSIIRLYTTNVMILRYNYNCIKYILYMIWHSYAFVSRIHALCFVFICIYLFVYIDFILCNFTFWHISSTYSSFDFLHFLTIFQKIQDCKKKSLRSRLKTKNTARQTAFQTKFIVFWFLSKRLNSEIDNFNFSSFSLSLFSISNLWLSRRLWYNKFLFVNIRTTRPT